MRERRSAPQSLFSRPAYKAGVLDRTVDACSRATAIDGREWSAMRSVARETVTDSRHSGQTGVIVLPVTPCRYDSAHLQCGQGPNHAVAMLSSPLYRRFGSGFVAEQT